MNDILFTPLRITDFETLIEKSFQRALEKMRAQNEQIKEFNPIKLHSIQELADYLQISTTTAQKYKNDGLPCIQYGRKLVFDTAEVLAWLSAQSKKVRK